MKALRKIYFLSSCLLLFLNSKEQVSLQFFPAIQGRTIDGLSSVQVFNSTSSTLRGFMLITVRDMNHVLVQVKTTSMDFRPGSNSLNRVIFSGSRFTFGNSLAAMHLRNTGRFPEGELEYCFEVNISESKNATIPEEYENCFQYYNQPFTPLLLINPIDGDEFCNPRPNFVWQPPLPLPADSRFRLMVSEIKSGQDISEAVSFNLPVINQGNIIGGNLLYPASAPDLKPGKTYAWQVTVYQNDVILTKSEIWTFSIKCDEQKKEITNESYRMLNEYSTGDYYVANKILRFSFHNPYEAGDLDYNITSLHKPSKIIKGLPALKMKPGLNEFAVDLSELNGFTNGEEYQLKLRLKNGRVLNLRLIYKDE